MSNTLSRLWSRWRGSPQAEGVNGLRELASHVGLTSKSPAPMVASRMATLLASTNSPISPTSLVAHPSLGTRLDLRT